MKEVTAAPADPERSSPSGMDPVKLGMAVGLLSALSYGFGTVINRFIVTEYVPPLTAALLLILFGAANLAVLSLARSRQSLKVPPMAYVHLITGGLFAMGGITLMFQALSRAPVPVVAPVASVIPMFVLLFSHLFLRRLERVTSRIVLGTFLVVTGVVLVTLSAAL